ncbi:PAS domain-containing protein [Candidatus Bathyarchaeota archaeon]|nr:PAS domain-containing protein [Candidatus Bathyarchaeota archaeon]
MNIKRILEKKGLLETSILDMLSEHVILYDHRMHIRWLNSAAAASLDMRKDDMLGKHCYELWHQRSSPCKGCPVMEAFETGTVQSFKIGTPDGRYWLVKGYPFKDTSTGEIIGAIEITLDITKQHEAEQLLASENERLKKHNDMQRNFIYNTTHEFKTPLTKVIGASSFILGEFKDELAPNIRELMEIVKKGADRLKLLVDQFLSIARVEANSLKQVREPVDLLQVSREVVHGFHPLIKRRQLEISLPDIVDSCVVQGNPEWLKEVVENLVMNAIKNTPPGGNITVDLEVIKANIMLTVSDTGIGLERADIDQLFTLFGKIDRDTGNMDVIREGSGLGLYLARKIVEWHHGSIMASSPGFMKGSKFTITLPRSP